MTEFVQIGDLQIPQTDLFSLLVRYQLLPDMVRELAIDRAIVEVECNDEERVTAIDRFCDRYQLTSIDRVPECLELQGLQLPQLEEIAIRHFKIEKFKQQTWSGKVESYFLQRKGQLDRAVYSLIRTSDLGIAQEIYFRLIDGEQTFAESARQYSQGAEAQTGEPIGPVELSMPHPTIANLITTQPLGQICPPLKIDRWYVIVRPEQLIPARLDAEMRQRLIDELFQTWVRERVRLANIPKSASMTSIEQMKA